MTSHHLQQIPLLLCNYHTAAYHSFHAQPRQIVSSAPLITCSTLVPMSFSIAVAALYSLQTVGHVKAHCDKSAAIIAGSEQDHVWPVVEVLLHNLATCQPVAPPGTPFLPASSSSSLVAVFPSLAYPASHLPFSLPICQHQQLLCAELSCLTKLVPAFWFASYALQCPLPICFHLSPCPIDLRLCVV